MLPGTCLRPVRARSPPDSPVALAAIVAGAHIFVEEVLHVADTAGLEPLVLSLVLAPFATELPEKANSFFWVRAGKDSLALGNVTGAMVFGPRRLPSLAGGVVAIITLQIRRRFSGRALCLWGALYAAFVGYVVATS
jgi:cation:H+ antiporter